MATLTFTAEVDDELAEAIKGLDQRLFDINTIWDSEGRELVAYIEVELVKIEGGTEIATDDEEAEMDREERPWVVGEVAHPGVIERFATHDEASRYIGESFDAEDVDAGRYYIDGPSED